MKGEKPQHFLASAREVFDVSGAGDTVVATMALAVAAGLPPNDGAALANVCSGSIVGRARSVRLPCTREYLCERDA